MRTKRYLHREAAQSGRSIKKTPPAWMKYRKSYNPALSDFNDEELCESVEALLMDLPTKGSPYYKNWDYRRTNQYLPAIRGVVKRFVGMSYDEFYSYVRENLLINSECAVKALKFALKDIYFPFFGEDGRMYGNSASKIDRFRGCVDLNQIAYRRSTNIYIVDDNNLIQIYQYTQEPEVNKSLTGFYRTDTSGVESYYIGPFYNSSPCFDDLILEEGYSKQIEFDKSDILNISKSWRYTIKSCDPYYLKLTPTRFSVFVDQWGYVHKSEVTKCSVVQMSELFPQ